jgi:hypothetical protein
MGATGLPGTVPSGTIIIVLDGDPVPAGYSIVGSFSQAIDDPGGAKKSKVTLNLYKKN